MPRLLLIAPDSFPPNLISGSIRNTKTLKFLAPSGWQATVLTTANGKQVVRNAGLNDDIPAGTDVTALPVPLFSLKQSINSLVETRPGECADNGKRASYPLKRLKNIVFGALRMLFLVPDDHILWAFPALWHLYRNGRRLSCDVVIASGPPFSGHVVGLIASFMLGKPFVPDYRDPWMGHEAFSPRNGYRKLLETTLERCIIARASFVPCATQPMIDDFLTRFPGNGKFRLIGNGFDPDDFAGRYADGSIDEEYGGVLRIAYIGSFGFVYDPRPFFEQLKAFVLEDRSRGERIRVTFAGLMTDDLTAYFKDPVLAPMLEFRGKVPHDEAVRIIRRAHVLLLLIFPGYTGYTVMTNKLYEYVGARKRILGIVPDGIARKVIERYGFGICLGHGEDAALLDAIRRLYHEWCGTGLPDLPPPPDVFTRPAQVAELHRSLAALLAKERQ